MEDTDKYPKIHCDLMKWYQENHTPRGPAMGYNYTDKELTPDMVNAEIIKYYEEFPDCDEGDIRCYGCYQECFIQDTESVCQICRSPGGMYYYSACDTCIEPFEPKTCFSYKENNLFEIYTCKFCTDIVKDKMIKSGFEIV